MREKVAWLGIFDTLTFDELEINCVVQWNLIGFRLHKKLFTTKIIDNILYRLDSI